MTRKDSYREPSSLRAGKIDILVGTQMIAKGLHFPNVTLVGIINADLALHLPDFRAGERTFQLLTQVAGRAGRGETPGEVFVQTYTPFSPSIQFARHHDFAGYFQQELEFRERCDFPPYKHAVLITVRSAHEGRARLSAETIVRRLRENLGAEFIVADATPAPLEKLQGQFRFHILMRGEAIVRLSRLIRETLDKLPLPEDVLASIDVDPYKCFKLSTRRFFLVFDLDRYNARCARALADELVCVDKHSDGRLIFHRPAIGFFTRVAGTGCSIRMVFCSPAPSCKRSRRQKAGYSHPRLGIRISEVGKCFESRSVGKCHERHRNLRLGDSTLWYASSNRAYGSSG